MVKLKSLRLINFGGYTDTVFNFEQFGPTGLSIKPLSLFYGPNGIGKSTVLEAIRLVSNPLIFKDRIGTPEAYLRQFVREDDYSPVADAMLNREKKEMRIEAVFKSTLREHRVVLTTKGFEVNELEEVHGGHVFYLDADHPMNWKNFQLPHDGAKMFIELAEAVYGFDCDLDGEVTDTVTNPSTNEKVTKLFYNDFIVCKGKSMAEVFGGEKPIDNPKRMKVHFARMSAGEKKLATALRMLCNSDNIATRDIILIDNIELHVYYKRHALMIDKLREFFPDKQIIATTHSGVMIEHVPSEFRYDLELYRPEYKMNEENIQKIAAKITEETTVLPTVLAAALEQTKLADKIRDEFHKEKAAEKAEIEEIRNETRLTVDKLLDAVTTTVEPQVEAFKAVNPPDSITDYLEVAQKPKPLIEPTFNADIAKERVEEAKKNDNAPTIPESYWPRVELTGLSPHMTEEGIILFGDDSLESSVWDHCKAKYVRRADYLVSRAIRFLEEDKSENGITTGISKPIHFPTPPHIKAAAEAKRAAEAARIEKERHDRERLSAAKALGVNLDDTGFLGRIRNAIRGMKKAWSYVGQIKIEQKNTKFKVGPQKPAVKGKAFKPKHVV